MKNKTNLFPGSIIALVLGILLAAPLLYTNAVLPPVAGSALFDVELSYVYIERQNNTVLGDPSLNNTQTLDVPCTQSIFGINFTQLSDPIVPFDAIAEVYQIDIYLEESLIHTIHKYAGIYTKSTPEFGKLVISEFLGNRHKRAVCGSLYSDLSVGQSKLSVFSDGTSAFWEPNSEPEKLSISISKLGWFTMTSNSSDAVILLEPEVILNVQLERFGEGFLHNTIVPEEQLAQIDLTYPFADLFELADN